MRGKVYSTARKGGAPTGTTDAKRKRRELGNTVVAGIGTIVLDVLLSVADGVALDVHVENLKVLAYFNEEE